MSCQTIDPIVYIYVEVASNEYDQVCVMSLHDDDKTKKKDNVTISLSTFYEQ